MTRNRKKKLYTRLRRFPEALEEARRVAGAENFRWMGWVADNQPFIIKYPLILSKMAILEVEIRQLPAHGRIYVSLGDDKIFKQIYPLVI